jgi:putative peptide zinc metalloprotease protein
MSAKTAAWPLLREELALLEDPRLPDGQPSWTLHDPVRNRFFSLDWPTFEILKRWSYGHPQAIAESVCADTTLALAPQDVMRMVEFVQENQLVQVTEAAGARQMADRLHKMQGTPLKWLLHHYLFFRVPLWNPDAWLARWQDVAGVFYRPGFWWLTAVVFLLGGLQVARQWDVFASTMVDTLTWSGLASYGVALLAVKWVHELGHAFTAKRLGCRVPAMGVAFLVMFPMAYTDTNETWRLTSHRQRLRIASAGIVTELMIAVWATWAWVLLPDGEWRSAMFFLATASWLATLAINASPFMRFDGYFILSDWLDMPNLHERSFALARWQLREWLFGLGEARPEHLSRGRERALIAFAWMTWLYRLVVFVGIALLVYHFFFKLLGVFLFVVELLWFIAMPVRSEWLEWKKRWPRIRQTGRSRVSALVLMSLVLLLAMPWPGRIGVSALHRPAQLTPLFAPGPARLLEAPPPEGTAVKAGEVLFRLEAPTLHLQRAALLARWEQMRWQTSTAGFDQQSRVRWQTMEQQADALQAELQALDAELGRYVVVAPYDGVLRDLDPDLAAGVWLSPREPLGLLVAQEAAVVVETYLDEAALRRVKGGQRAVFVPEGRPEQGVAVEVSRIDADATRVLPDGRLAAPAGGHVLVREQQGQWWPETAHYRVVLTPLPGQEGLHGLSLRGRLVIRTEAQSPLLPYLQSALAVLVREWGF